MELLTDIKANIEKFDDSVVLIEYEANTQFDENDMIDIEQSIGQLIGKHAYYAISILPQSFKNFSEDARNFITDENLRLENRVVDCYIVNSLSRRLELEVFFQLHKPTLKTKIFNSLNKALTFVAEQKKLEENKKGVLV